MSVCSLVVGLTHPLGARCALLPTDGVLLPDGLYFLKQRSSEKGVDHYGILDVGNRLRIPGVDGINPVVVHQTPPHIQWNYLVNTGWWTNLGRIADEPEAMARMQAALAIPAYDLVTNNCEHLARFAATGRRESTQVQASIMGVLALALGAAFALALASGERAA